MYSLVLLLLLSNGDQKYNFMLDNKQILKKCWILEKIRYFSIRDAGPTVNYV